jgi:hypothetical protein
MSRLKRHQARQLKKSIVQAKPARRKIERNRLLVIELLEQRVVLSQDTWTGAAGDNNWQTASNWSAGVPTTSSSVMIDVSGNPTISDNSNTSILNLTDYDSLDITGGSFTTNSGVSKVMGALTVSPGASLTINNAGSTFTDGTSTTINGANLYAYYGASMTLSAATSLAGATFGTTIDAYGTSGTGTPSIISFPNLTNLSGATDNYFLYLEAESGGELGLPEVSNITSGRVDLTTSGAGSVLYLTDLTTITGDQTNDSSLNVGGGATLLDPVLTTLDRTDFEADDTGDTFNTATITSLIDNNDYATAGAVVSFPGVTTLAGGPNGTTIEPYDTVSGGTPSTISFPNLTNLSGATGNNVFYLLRRGR